MINKKMSRILGPILGVMGFMLTIGVFEIPVLADDNVQATSGYTDTTSFSEYKDYSLNINKSVEQNGLKITLDKVTGTKHKLKTTIKLESETPFDDDYYIANNSIVQVTYGKNNGSGEGRSFEPVDDKTVIINIEQDNDDNEFPEKGELRVDVVFPDYKVNIGIDAQVDFSESFKNTIEKNLSIKIPEFDFTLNKFNSNILGATITYNSTKNSSSYDDYDNKFPYSTMILKVGDKMYKTRSTGSSSSDDGKTTITTGTFEAEAATYDKVKDQKDISIIPVVCNMSYDDMDNLYQENNRYDEEKISDKQTVNNVSYSKIFEFADGTTGEIYNIEKNDNTIKIYCRGNSEKESLLMASNLSMSYTLADGTLDYMSMYDNSQYMSFYKDSNDTKGYIVEFDNIEKDKAVNLAFENSIKQNNKYKIGDEIQISK